MTKTVQKREFSFTKFWASKTASSQRITHIPIDTDANNYSFVHNSGARKVGADKFIEVKSMLKFLRFYCINLLIKSSNLIGGLRTYHTTLRLTQVILP